MSARIIAARGGFLKEARSPAERPSHRGRRRHLGIDFLEATDGNFDFIHDLVIENIENVQCLEILFQLLGAGSSEDNGTDVWIFEQPGDTELWEGGPEFLGDCGELLQDLDSSLGLEAREFFLHPIELGVGEAGVFGNALVVFAGEDTSGEGGKGGSAEADLGIEAGVFDLEAVSFEDVVLRLLHGGRREVVLAGDGVGFHDLLGRPFGGAPIQDFALLDEHVHGPHRFFDWSVRIGPVAVVEVEVVDAEASKGRFACFDDMLFGEADLIGLVAAPEDLRGNDEAVACPAELRDSGAHDFFGLASGIAFGVVEKIYS